MTAKKTRTKQTTRKAATKKTCGEKSRDEETCLEWCEDAKELDDG